MLKVILALLFPVALLGGALALTWFVLAAGFQTTTHWLEGLVQELP